MQIVKYLLFAFLLAGIAGCAEEDEYMAPQGKPVDKIAKEQPAATQNLSHDLVFNGSDTSNDMSEAFGASKDVASSQTSDHDYIQKCDIYWKFDYIKRTLEAGIMQSDLKVQLDKIKKQAKSTLSDENKDLINQILNTLDNAMAAETVNAKIKASGIDPASLSWGIGRLALEDHLRASMSINKTTTSGKTTPAMTMVLDYEAKYHQSPDQVHSRSCIEACRKIGLLGHNLGLEGQRGSTGAGNNAIDLPQK